MTQTNFDLIVLTLLLLGLTTFAATRNIFLLAMANAICMTCAPMLGQPLVLLGHPNDCGAIFFTIAMYGLSLKYLAYGAKEAYRGVGHIIFAMMLVLTSAFLLQGAGLLNPLFGMRIQIAGARLIVFCLTLPLFVYVLQRPTKLPPLLRIPAITGAMLIIDGLVFFPCAFIGLMPIDFVMPFALYCTELRLVVAMMSIPFLAVFLCLKQLGFIPHLVPEAKGTHP